MRRWTRWRAEWREVRIAPGAAPDVLARVLGGEEIGTEMTLGEVINGMISSLQAEDFVESKDARGCGSPSARR
jgi:hypothetical protein